MSKSKIKIFHTHSEIYDYNLGDCPKLEKDLSLWDGVTFKLHPFGYEYDEDTKTLYIPRGINPWVLRDMFNIEPDMMYQADEFETTSIKLKTEPRNNLQKEAISFLLGEGEFKRTVEHSQLLLTLKPGDGKTYIGIAASILMGMKTMVICHTERILNQWVERYQQFSDMNERDIYIIQGKSSIDKLMKMKNPKYKVYICMMPSLRSYLTNQGKDEFQKFFKHTKVGLKMYDEAHLYFASILAIDRYTNVKRTIYITATFDRTDREENRLFKRCFHSVVGYTPKYSDDSKHIVYMSILFNSRPTQSDVAYMSTFRGFNKNRFANYIINKEEFYEALNQAAMHFSRYDGRMIVLSSSIESVEANAEYLRNVFPNRQISTYHSKVSDKDKELASSADIICSTSKSLGTGADFSDVRTIIMCETYSNKVTAIQTSGRLRAYADGSDSYYIELIDIGFPKIVRMYNGRKKVFGNICKRFIEYKVKKGN